MEGAFTSLVISLLLGLGGGLAALARWIATRLSKLQTCVHRVEGKVDAHVAYHQGREAPVEAHGNRERGDALRRRPTIVDEGQDQE